MKALALVIGNDKYNSKDNELKNAVNDASDFAKKLITLGFTVDLKKDTTIETFDRSLVDFGNELTKYDFGLFYFSGHGLQIKGINYLTGVDTSFADTTSVKHSSIKLDEIIERMNDSGARINILILDACRNNPLPTRGINEGLAPVYAPKGTFIAFSTSPGETAKDGGAGNNSIYTGSLLKHIDDRNITIEDLFKRVRTTVYNQTGGEQTSWEHTSLIGSFYFNQGQLTHSVEVPYKVESVADEKFVSDGSEIDKIIEGLRSHDWYQQKPALEMFESIAKTIQDKSKLFLVGRNILQAAAGGEGRANDVLSMLDKWLQNVIPEMYHHVLNGILFEIYFDSKGNFRIENFKNHRIDEIFQLQVNPKHKESFDFIGKQLENFKGYIYYIPSDNPQSVPLEITLELNKYKVVDKEYEQLIVTSIKHEEVELLHTPFDSDFHRSRSFINFKDEITNQLAIPEEFLTISSNITISDATVISYPYDMTLQNKSV